MLWSQAQWLFVSRKSFLLAQWSWTGTVTQVVNSCCTTRHTHHLLFSRYETQLRPWAEGMRKQPYKLTAGSPLSVPLQSSQALDEWILYISPSCLVSTPISVIAHIYIIILAILTTCTCVYLDWLHVSSSGIGTLGSALHSSYKQKILIVIQDIF